ncbi:hypothetical protein F4823DRAFT_451685 [Ustulina deusta]|nr:hypothetical protein F4823DRAFT_451685 [Ustulina deusta]
MLRLLDTTDEDIQQGVHLLADRAALWVIYGTILVHLSTKIIEQHDLEGLLRIDCPDSTDAYTSCAGFDLVAEACREVREAICILYAARLNLDRGARFCFTTCPGLENGLEQRRRLEEGLVHGVVSTMKVTMPSW